jgi:hypothetical protein
MLLRSKLVTTLIFGITRSCIAQGESASKPSELEVLKQSVGVWDAEIEIWPAGPDSRSIKFKGVETNRPYGEYWIASDFDSEYEGQITKVHSIVGYDLDKKKLVGTVIDHGPYAATMTGDYDEKAKTVHWVTEAKDQDGKPISQNAQVTRKTADERLLVCLVPGEKKDEFTKFMQIRYLKRN